MRNSRSFLSSMLMTGASALLILLSTGCGKSSLVKSAQIALTTTPTNETFADLTLRLNTGSLAFPALELPVLDPNQMNRHLGRIIFIPVLGGRTDVTLGFNITQAANTPGLDGGLLPNGNEIPFNLPTGVSIFSFPVGNGNTRAYLAFGDGLALFGMAVTIREFVDLGRLFGDLSFFPAFKSGKIRGVAGVFTSPIADRNGIGLFADISDSIDPEIARRFYPGWTRHRRPANGGIDFERPNTPVEVQKRLRVEIDQIGRRNPVLTIN